MKLEYIGAKNYRISGSETLTVPSDEMWKIQFISDKDGYPQFMKLKINGITTYGNIEYGATNSEANIIRNYAMLPGGSTMTRYEGSLPISIRALRFREI